MTDILRLPHYCIACGRRIRWALRSCFDCNRVVIESHYPRRYLRFT